MIIAADENSLMQRAPDGQQRTVPFADLVAGIVILGEQGELLARDPNAIALPPWPENTQEFLFRTKVPSTPTGPRAHAHRRLVNAVHAQLVAQGRVPPALSADFESETARPASDRVELPYEMPDDVIAAIEAHQRSG